MTPEDRLRWFLEQMMMRFTMLGVPVARAASELVETEAYLSESGADPVEALGDPEKFAMSLIPRDELMSLYRANLRRDLASGICLGGALFAGIQMALSWFGSEVLAVPKMLLLFAFVALYSVGQVAFSSVLLGVADGDTSLRFRGLAKVCATVTIGLGVLMVLLALAGADFGSGATIQLTSQTWTASFLILVAAAGYVFARLFRLRSPNESVVEGGTTGQILYEMNNNSHWVGWVRFGPDGTDLRDPDWSWKAELKKITIGTSGPPSTPPAK